MLPVHDDAGSSDAADPNSLSSPIPNPPITSTAASPSILFNHTIIAPSTIQSTVAPIPIVTTPPPATLPMSTHHLYNQTIPAPAPGTLSPAVTELTPNEAYIRSLVLNTDHDAHRNKHNTDPKWCFCVPQNVKRRVVGNISCSLGPCTCYTQGSGILGTSGCCVLWPVTAAAGFTWGLLNCLTYSCCGFCG